MTSPRQMTLTEFLYEHVDSFPPDRPAIIDHDSGLRLSYGDLKRQVGAVASALAKRNFGRGQFLTLFVSNCLENTPIAHGTIATGGTLHLVRPSVSRDDLLVHTRLVRPRFFVTTTDHAAVAHSVAQEADCGVEDVFVIGLPPSNCRSASELLGDAGDANPMGRVEIDPDNDVAALLQTGGTTGFAKMVMATHKALMSFDDEPFSFTKCASDVIATFSPFSYVNSFNAGYRVWLRAGATVVSMSKFSPDALLKVIDQYQVTGFILSASIAVLMIRSPQFEKSSLSSLKWLMAGGAPIPKETERFILKSFEEKSTCDVQYIQVYASTEALDVITENLPENRIRFDKEGSVGWPRPNMKIKVMNIRDDSLECKAGERGQILISSPLLMKGYFKNEEKTAKALRNGWYYTGDYGWLDEDNFLFIVDRIADLIVNDEAVIMPSELEAIIQCHPKVKDCMVIGKKMEGGEWPMVYVVADEPVSTDDIQQFVADRVERSRHLRGGVKFIEKIPRSGFGKVLRKSFGFQE